ncbi:MAG: hypothetical protein JO324_06795 [Candidatus Eremiobacteraeota bacterium]|nr:hypothetical protein [Candidatus Eremiobacteraeota bacterium]
MMPFTNPSNAQPPTSSSRTFHFTHTAQKFKVQAGVTQLTVTAYGAMGGGYSSKKYGYPGGLGAAVKATIPVMSGQFLFIYVGGRGIFNKHGEGGAGFNGGGGSNGAAFGGGGSSDVRAGGDTVADRILVAGGGGGSGEAGSGGYFQGTSSSGYYILFAGPGGIGGAWKSGGNGQAGQQGGGGGAGGSQKRGGAGGIGLNGSSVSFSYHYSCDGINGTLGKFFDGGAGASDGCGPAGGGGGGGYFGGGGGGGGGYYDNVATGGGTYENGGGGGGGGGSSFVEKSATHVQRTAGGGLPGNGEIIIAW